MTGGGTVARLGAALDLLVVTGLLVGGSFVLGIGWSVLRVGILAWPFVREAQFLLAVLLLGVWVLRNWSAPVSDRDGSDRPPLQRGFRSGSDGVSVTPGLSADVYLIAAAVTLLALSVGIDVWLS